VKARLVMAAAAAAFVLFAFIVAACRQVLGVSDLQVDAAAGDASGTDSGQEAQQSVCNTQGATFESCYSCCSTIDGGDPNFFRGGLQHCACSAGCLGDCPNYCDSGAGSDPPPNCDICVYDSFRGFGSCQQQAAANGDSGGGALVYECIRGCPTPTSNDCSNLLTSKECYDCCEANDVNSTTSLFGQARSCVCDAGCAAECPSYCPSGGVDNAACTRCALQSLLDGGCVGAASCSGNCSTLSQCLQGCTQQQ
jgi:hypothetical protein